MAIAKSRFITVLALAFALVTLVVRWAKIFVPSAGLAPLDNFLSLLFLGMLAVIVLFQVFREGPITMRRISGAVVVYLLLGIMWALAYQLIELQQPGSFNFADAPAIGDTLSPRLVYFSFVTTHYARLWRHHCSISRCSYIGYARGADRPTLSSHPDCPACIYGALLPKVNVDAMRYRSSIKVIPSVCNSSPE